MDWVWYMLLAVTMVLGLPLIVIGLPGLWLMVGAVGVYGWITGWQYVGLWTLVTLVVIGLISEIVEFIAGGAGAKKVGGSRRATWGALVGGIAGALFLTIPLPVVGTIIGACLGAFIGAVVMEYTVHGGTRQSVRVGVGAAKGKFWGIVSKLGFAVIVMIVALAMAMPLPGRRRQAPQTQPVASLDGVRIA